MRCSKHFSQADAPIKVLNSPFAQAWQRRFPCRKQHTQKHKTSSETFQGRIAYRKYCRLCLRLDPLRKRHTEIFLPHDRTIPRHNPSTPCCRKIHASRQCNLCTCLRDMFCPDRRGPQASDLAWPKFFMMRQLFSQPSLSELLRQSVNI